MNELIARLAKARHVEALYKDKLVSLEKEIQDMIDERYGTTLTHYRSLVSAARDELAEVENEARQVALDLYAQDGNKKPHPSVQIKMYTVLGYEQKDALEYCRTALPQALKLDKRQFEKVAKVVDLDFVTIEQEPRVTIATDLSDYLE